jgi:hypothetical protein
MGGVDDRKRKRKEKVSSFHRFIVMYRKETFGKYINSSDVSRIGYVPTFIGLSGRHSLTFHCDKNERHFHSPLQKEESNL